MTLEQLKYFQAVVEHGSFRAAAEALFRSQSSLSISIQKLETELGIMLFERQGYRPKLTKAGLVMYQKARHLLHKSAELQGLAAHLASGHEPELKLAISGILPLEPVLRVLEDIDRDHTHTRIDIMVENLSGTEERLLDDDADIALTDTFQPDNNLESLLLTQVTFVSVVPSSSKWAKYAATLTEQDLEDETLIVVRDTSHHSAKVSQGIIEGAPQWVVNDFATKKQIIASGKGWGRMPLHLVEDDIKKGTLTTLKSSDFQAFNAPVFMLRKKHRPSTGIVEDRLWQALQHIHWQCC